MTTFIPDDHVNPFDIDPAAICTNPTLGVIDLVHKGDDRGFIPPSFNLNIFRTRQLSLVDANPNTPPTLLNFQSVGQTRSYAFDAILNDGNLNSSDEDGVPLDCVLWHEAGQEGTGSMSITPRVIQQTKAVDVRFAGSATNPLLNVAAAIDWNLFVSIEIDGGEAKYMVHGQWDGYPNLEIYINDVPIYTEVRGLGILCLAPFLCDSLVLGSGTLP